MKRFIALMLFLLFPVMASASWYTDCRDQVPLGQSCKQAYNSVSICCRNKYDASGPPKDINSFTACVNSNAIHYADCSPGAALALNEPLSKDAFIASLLAAEYSRLAADLQAPVDDNPKE